MEKPTFDFQESFEMTGRWWSAETPDHQQSGVLIFSPTDRATLQLHGTIKDEVSLPQDDEYPLIHGLSAQGEEITLVGSIQGSKTDSNGFLTSEIIPEFIVRGAYLDFASTVEFNEIRFHLDFLEDWLGITGVAKSIRTDRESGRLEDIKCDYRKPQSIEFEDSDFRISFLHSIKYESNPDYQFNLSETVLLSVAVSIPLSLDSLIQKYVVPIRNLLSIAIGSPIRIRRIIVRRDGLELPSEDRKIGLDYRGPLDVVFPFIQSVPRAIALPRPPFTLFSFGELSGSDGVTLIRWLNLSEKLEPAMESFFGAIHSDRLSLEQVFRNYISAIETYHRRTRKNYVLDEVDNSARLESILESVPNEHKDWIRTRIEYGNEPSLAVRLKELFDEIKWCFDCLPKQRRKIVRLIVDTRNYNTHFDTTLQGRAAHGQSMFLLSRCLHWVMICHFLHEAMDDWEKVKSVVTRNHDYLYFRRHQLGTLLNTLET